MSSQRHPGYWRRMNQRAEVQATMAALHIKWRQEFAALRELERMDAPAVCACGNAGCDGLRYRPCYSRDVFPCPLRASAQSSANTARSAD